MFTFLLTIYESDVIGQCIGLQESDHGFIDVPSFPTHEGQQLTVMIGRSILPQSRSTSVQTAFYDFPEMKRSCEPSISEHSDWILRK